MRIGTIFPQTEIGGDVGAVRAYGQAVAGLGFAHIGIYDHVVGADPTVHTGWAGPYNLDSTFHEPLVVFGYLAAIADVELVTQIIIGPQRQTVLLAKQAAEVDLLTQGRFRLGLGVGWNAIEYEALGENFSTRGRRLDEQITLLRRLWTESSITHHGEFDTVTGAGLAPMPVQRPIPIWLGAASPAAYQRIGRTADGWFPMRRPGPALDAAKSIVDNAAIAAGRDPATIGMEGGVSWSIDGGGENVANHAQRWRDAGATHLSITTMNAGLSTVDAHIDALVKTANALGVNVGK